jgi:hypothetical protein
MKALRKEDLSLHHYVKIYALQNFIEEEKNIPLSYVDEESSPGSYVYESKSNMQPLPISRGRGWVYLDNPTDTTEQTSSGTISVYDSEYDIIDSSNYMIDYIDGRVILVNPAIVPATINYKWHYVSTVDEWLDMQEVSELPVIVVGISKFHKEGFQLGGGRYVPRQIDINIFASNGAEKDDLTECLYDALYQKSCSYQSFPKGTSLDWDGTWNNNYQYTTVSGSSNLKFTNVIATTVRVATATPSTDVSILSDINRYRSRVSFDMMHWEEA